jgi:hypothetical protein
MHPPVNGGGCVLVLAHPAKRDVREISMMVDVMVPYMLAERDVLTDDAGVPFAVVDGAPWTDESGSVWVATRSLDGAPFLPIEFPDGTHACVAV